MQIYIAKEGDTLRKIAKKYHYEEANLLSLNPHITGIDLNMIPGTQVNLPSPRILVEEPFEILIVRPILRFIKITEFPSLPLKNGANRI